MKKNLPMLIISLVFGLLSSVRMYAQNQWDIVLDKYDEICTTCIELREMIGRGENVPAVKISSLLGEMRVLRERLKDSSSSMTPRQRKRYEDIRDSYASHFGNEPEARQEKSSLIPRMSTDQFISEAVSLKTDELLAATQFEQVQSRDRKFHFGMSGTCTFSSEMQYGLMLSGSYKKVGGYISASSNFQSLTPSYKCNSSGEIEGGGAFWGNGEIAHSLFTVCAGPTYRICNYLDVYAGAGLFYKQTLWKDAVGNWAEVIDLTHRSLCGEAGIMANLKGLTLTAGVRAAGAPLAVYPMAGLGFEF